jgi:hypothetical protein
VAIGHADQRVRDGPGVVDEEANLPEQPEDETSTDEEGRADPIAEDRSPDALTPRRKLVEIDGRTDRHGQPSTTAVVFVLLACWVVVWSVLEVACDRERLIDR